MASQEAELEVLIRARYPIIYLVSWEEQRVEAMLQRVAERQQKRLFVWTATQGICEKGKACDAGVVDPKAALDYIRKSAVSGLYVLKDFHPYIADAASVRRLRDLVSELKGTYKTVILLSPVLTLPVELEKDVTVIDYDLPGAAEIFALLQDVVKASEKSKKFSVDFKAGEPERIVQAALGMTLTEIENAVAKAIIEDSRLGGDDLGVLFKEKKQIIRKSRLLEYFEAQEEFSGVGGLQPLKEWLERRGRAFSDEARRFGLPQPKGILLLGVQGCGKSLVCKALSALWKLPLLRLDMGSIFGGFVGQSEENMRRAIKTAESLAPCVLWLDEIEKGLAGTGSSNTSDAGTTARVFSTFLTWLQEKTKPVFIAATANDISQLPPELLRKGRLDEIFFVDLPTAGERAQIFSIHLKKRGRDPAALRVEDLAKATDGYSGAEIEQCVVEGLYAAFHEKRELSADDLARAAKTLVPLSKTMAEEVKRLRDWAAQRARPASAHSNGSV